MNMFVGTRELTTHYWKVSRTKLYLMRNDGQLIQGIHYVAHSVKGREKLYWNPELIEHGLINGFDSHAHTNKCMDYRRKFS